MECPFCKETIQDGAIKCKHCDSMLTQAAVNPAPSMPLSSASMKVAMRNPKTGEIKEIKIGWSWILFLFSGFFGLPLFLRKLNVWGGIFLALWAVNFVGSSTIDDFERVGSTVILSLIALGLQIYMGIKGNELTAKNYLELGWVFVDPDSVQVKMAKGQWGIAV